MDEPIDLESVRAAHERIRPHVHRTPVLTSRSLDYATGARCFFKCENFQRAGAFKFRGSMNAVIQMDSETAARGVVTHSSGNHAAALALAGSIRGIPVHVVMPRNAVSTKRRAVETYGADVVTCEPTLEARERAAASVMRETGACLVHPYDNVHVIAGQGTAALELLAEVPELDVIVAPVGGGGLLSGTAVAVTGESPGTRIIGAEPEQTDDARRSLQAGRRLPVGTPDTIADGLRTSLGELTFPIIQRHVADILTVSEPAILEAMRMTWERMKIVIEPSAAVAVGVLLRHSSVFAGRRVGVILSGGNVDLGNLPW